MKTSKHVYFSKDYLNFVQKHFFPTEACGGLFYEHCWDSGIKKVYSYKILAFTLHSSFLERLNKNLPNLPNSKYKKENKIRKSKIMIKFTLKMCNLVVSTFFRIYIYFLKRTMLKKLYYLCLSTCINFEYSTVLIP